MKTRLPLCYAGNPPSWKWNRKWRGSYIDDWSNVSQRHVFEFANGEFEIVFDLFLFHIQNPFWGRLSIWEQKSKFKFMLKLDYLPFCGQPFISTWNVWLFTGKITTLDIGNNDIGPKGALHVANFIKKSKSLQWLNVYMNDMGDEVWNLVCYHVSSYSYHQLLLWYCLSVFREHNVLQMLWKETIHWQH